MDINNIKWKCVRASKVETEEVMIDVTVPIEPDITCHELYFLFIEYGHIRRYPRKKKKAFFYGTKNAKLHKWVQNEVCKYLL